jgi:hypothetical protein
MVTCDYLPFVTEDMGSTSLTRWNVLCYRYLKQSPENLWSS